MIALKVNSSFFNKQDVVAHAGIVLEGTLPQYLDGIWKHCHLQVTNSFAVESRESKQVQRELQKLPDLHLVFLLQPDCPRVCGWMNAPGI